MAYAILRTAKLTSYGNVAGSLAHTYRKDGMAPNANPTASSKNKTLYGDEESALSDVQNRIQEVTGGKVRKNAVLCIEYFLGASPEFFKGKGQKDVQEWADAQVDFLKKRHGVNLINATLHMDESTPHVVAYVVPEVSGKLNCREILGGREKLRDLQNNYAEAMEQFGLERGVEGSKATHQTVKKFYSQIKEGAKPAIKIASEIKISDPPIKTFLKSDRKYNEELKDWKKKEELKIKSKTMGIISKATQAEVLKKENNNLKMSNSVLSEENEELRLRLTAAYEEASLSKEDIAVLRKLDVSLVAQRLDYLGEVAPKANAIDLVKDVAGFDYQQAVAWLASEFGPDVAGAAVAQEASVKPPERPLTPAENVISREVAKQLDALGCDKYRVTLVPSSPDAKPYLPGKVGNEERFYDRQGVKNLIPFLRYRNNQGDNVFVTPMDDNAFYVLLDDAKRPSSEWVKAGYTPCMAQKTSWNSEQIVFKVPHSIERRDVLNYFNKINKTEGDPEITGLRHPFRLAGFRNMKPKHEKNGQHPFVTIERAVNTFCEKTVAAIKTLRHRYDAERSEAAPNRQRRGLGERQ